VGLVEKGYSLNEIEEAIFRTVLYADVFHFPMSVREIHHFLIADEPFELSLIEQTIATSPRLADLLTTNGHYYACAGRGDLIPLRIERERASQELWSRALFYGKWLARLPFVRMVALTGALAMRNAADADDDVDFILVTADQRVWLARAFAIVLVRLGRLRGITLCPNYVLAESALEQGQHDLFIAHEVVQMVPIFGFDAYHAMRACNPWVADFLPNAEFTFYPEREYKVGGVWSAFKRVCEFLLGGGLGDRLENWEYERKRRRFAGEMKHKQHHAAQIDEQRVKGHFDDHGHPVLLKYHERLRHYHLDKLPMAGD
jgi:hypothetical protein